MPQYVISGWEHLLKISQKLVLNNILVGFVPIIIAFTLVIIILKRQAENYVRTTLTSSMAQFKESLEAEMNKFRDYSYFISREAINLMDKARNNGNLSSYKNQVTANRYKLRMFELFKKDKVFYRDMYSWDDNIYTIKPLVATEIWEKLSDPLYTRHFKISYPDVISNVLIIRNCSIIYNENSDKKVGFSAISTPIDNVFLKEFGYQDKDEIIVIMSETGLSFSNDEFNTPAVVEKIFKASKENPGKYQILNLGQLGKYYFYRENLYKVTKVVNRKVEQNNIADVAILYNYKTVNQQIQTLLKIVIILFVAVVALVLTVSVLFTRSIIPPIMSLKKAVEKFQKDMSPVPDPGITDDEIGILHRSFSQMSHTVLEKSEDLTEALTQLALANEQLSNMTILDGLTGVKNRRYFNKKIEREVKRASRLNKTLSLLMLDIDHFKSINDNYGHQAGDICLQRLAETLSSHIHRAGDEVARYGGEEFSIVLPNTDLEGASELAENIRKAVMNSNVTYDKKKIKLTVSIGVASVSADDHMEDENQIIHMADQALYEAKETGRNKVVVYKTTKMTDVKKPKKKK